MKKTFEKLIFAILTVVLVACSNVPSNMTSDAYDVGIKISEVVDQYLNAELSAKEASEKIDFLNKQIDADTKNGDYLGNQGLSVKSGLISTMIELEDVEGVKKEQKELKKLLNK